MRLILAAPEEHLAHAFELHCNDLPDVDVRRRLPFDVECDAVVSAGNSFGFLARGIDLLYSKRFGSGIEARLQKTIRSHHAGELLVGQAIIIETEDPFIPYLILSPSMRASTDPGRINMFLSMRAVMLLWAYGTLTEGPNAGRPISQVVHTIAFSVPECGEMPNLQARQIRAALDDFGFPQRIVDFDVSHPWATPFSIAVCEYPKLLALN